MENSPEKNIGINKKDPWVRVIEGKEYKKVPSGYTVRQWYSHESEKGPGPGWDSWSRGFPEILEEYGVSFSVRATPEDLPDTPYYIWEPVEDKPKGD